MRVLVDITPHGFGHAAQTVAAINALYRHVAGLKVLIRTRIPRHFLERRMHGAFDYIGRSNDFGLRMQSALRIDLERSAAGYAGIHNDWSRRVDAEACEIQAWRPDLVLANVSYLTLAAAGTAGIASVAMCSLNWAAIYRHYFATRPEADGILRQMIDAYNSAGRFLCPQPSMPMPELDHVYAIGCVSDPGCDRRKEINARLAISGSDRLVVVSLGGTPADMPAGQWPSIAGVHWIMPDHWCNARHDMHSFSEMNMSFTDLLRSADAMVGKCGYGTVSECAVNTTPLIYIPRPEWPEEEVLVSWLEANGTCEPWEPDAGGSRALGRLLERCWSAPARVPPGHNGADEAAQHMLMVAACAE